MLLVFHSVHTLTRPRGQVDSSGLTPLMDGARMGHETVCDVLVSNGADVLQLDNLKRSALHHVTQAGQVLL